MKQSAAVSHLRQLCSLGIGGAETMPAILSALHDIIGSDSNGFFWLDERHDISNLYAEKMLPPKVMETYFREFYNANEVGFKARFAQFVRARRAVTRASLSRAFYDSDYYNVIWRHLDAHHVMYGSLFEGDACHGQLSVYRSVRDPGFTDKDERALAAVLPYITHAVIGGRLDAPRAFDCSGQTGVAIVSPTGEPEQMSPEAERLMFLATHPSISHQSLVTRGGGLLPAEVRELCARLQRVDSGRSPGPPVVRTENVWGRFVMRAYWLTDTDGARRPRIAILVQHFEQREIRLMRSMQGSKLSPRQRETVMHIARGLSDPAIGRIMGVSADTVKYNVKQIFTKLGVHSRTDLLDSLALQLAA